MVSSSIVRAIQYSGSDRSGEQQRHHERLRQPSRQRSSSAVE
jgi:hypothetical protein